MRIRGGCLQGLAEVVERRGDTGEALQCLDPAAALFQEYGAKLYLDRVIAKKVKLQGIESGDIKSSVRAVAAMAESEQFDLSPHAAPDGTVRDALRSRGGSEVKTMGDGFMLAFSSARRALQCAIAIQRAFARRNEAAYRVAHG